MNRKIVLEVNEPLVEGELLMYKGGKVQSISIHELLPQYTKALGDIAILQKRVCELTKSVKELRGEEDE